MGEIGQIPNHQVKVDNWPLFFLQRLHHFYKKKSHCDLTLLFSTLDTVKSVKVHKLVLHACTDYFESLDIMKDSEHGEVLQLSNEMHPDVVIPIISFMYTGKLEFPVTLQPRLYEAATKLRMTILTKLLDVQPKKTLEKPTQQQTVSDGVKVSISQSTMPNTAETLQVEEPIVTLTPVTNIANISPKKIVRPDVTFIHRPDSGSIKPSIQMKGKPVKKITGSQLSPVTSKPKVIDPNLPPTLPGRKLPVWKRKVPLSGSKVLENTQNIGKSTLKPSEMPKPTRFEWDEDLNDPTALRPVEEAPKCLSHDGTSKIAHPIILDDEDFKKKNSVSDDSLKRSSDGSSSESPPYKKSRSDLQDMKEYGKQQQLRNEILCSEENEENDENDVDDPDEPDDLYGACDEEQEETPDFNQSAVNSSTPKPILKTVSKPEPPVSPKRVRFSLEGKENNQQENESSSDFTVTKPTSEPTITKQKIVLPMDVSQIQSGKHHVKIVSEVLKKYPSLAKRENIKLRVVSKNPAAVPPAVQKAVEGKTGTGSKSASSLVSYIFLTNKSSGEMIPVKNTPNEKDKGFDVENKTGPWFCHVCKEGELLEFESYYTYRKHLVEVHDLKIDARICEYCGLKNSKRNHLLYHLYTKHGINPPAHVSFPKCPECDYIALSDALLLKHKSSHDPKGLKCYTCNVVFKTYSSMQLHMNSDWHRNTINEVSVLLSDYPCPFCEERFESGHLSSDCHSQKMSPKEEYKQIYRCPYCESLFGSADFLGKHIVSVHWGKDENAVKEQGSKMETCQPQSGQQLQNTAKTGSSEKKKNTENQSSELESLSNVATSIATSLGLAGSEQTVVFYEQKADETDIGREATIVSDGECKEYIITGPLENIDGKQSQEVNEVVHTIDLENDDSDSRTSNTEEVNPTSCSDHDYSEPHVDDNYRQVIPVQTVENQIEEGAVIQEIVPEQRLVFSNQGNVVFPQRVLLTSGDVVLPSGPGEQNVILSQVLPSTRIILSGSILQQSGGIMDEGNGAIVFTNSDSAQMGDSLQTVHYQISTSENVESDEQEKTNSGTSEENCPQEEKKEEKVSEDSEEIIKNKNLNSVQGKDKDNSDVQTVSEEFKITNRLETSKIVDEWDEMNDNSNNVESRSDGPSRPEFFLFK